MPFAKVLELVRFGNRREDTLSFLVVQLDRRERRLTPDQQAQLAAVPGALPLCDSVTHMLDHLDPDWLQAEGLEALSTP